MHNCRDPRPADTSDWILVVGRARWRRPLPRTSVGLPLSSILALPCALGDDVAAAMLFIVYMNAPLRLDATRIDPGTFEPHSERGDEQWTLRLSCSPWEGLETGALQYDAHVQVIQAWLRAPAQEGNHANIPGQFSRTNRVPADVRVLRPFASGDRSLSGPAATLRLALSLFRSILPFPSPLARPRRVGAIVSGALVSSDT